MKNYILGTLFIFIPLMVYGQRSTQRMYTIDDGFFSSTFNGAWMTYDSLFYVWDGSRTNSIAVFDGYQVKTIENTSISPYVLVGMANGTEYSFVLNSSQGFFLYKDEVFSLILDLSAWPKDLLGVWYANKNLYRAQIDKTVERFDLQVNNWVLDHYIDEHFHETLDSLFLNGEKVRYRELLSNNHVLLGDSIYTKNESTDQFYAVDTILKLPINHDVLKSDSLDHSSVDQWRQLFQHKKYSLRSKYLENDSYRTQVMKEGDGRYYLVEYDENGDYENLGAIKGANSPAFKLNAQAYYISSHEGLQKINPKIKYFSSNEPEMVGGLYSIIESNDTSIYLGGYGTGYSVYKTNSLKKIKGKYSGAFVLPGGGSLSNGRSLVFQDNYMIGLYLIESGLIKKLDISTANRGIQVGYIVKELADGSIALGNPNSEVTIIENLENLDSIGYLTKADGLKVKNVLCIEEDNQGRLWFGHPSTGIDLYDRVESQAYNYEIISGDANSFGAISMVVDDKDRLWMGSRSGLKVLENVSTFDPKTQNLFSETKSITLPNGDFSLPKFVTEVDGYIVAGTETAVSFIDKKSYTNSPDNPIIYQLIYGEDIEGNGSQQNSVLFDSQRRLWIGSNEGASMMLWDDYEWDQTINKIEVKSIESGIQSIQLNKEGQFKLPVDNRNFTIKFGLRRNVNLLKNVFFDYFLINEDQDTLQQVLFDQDGILDMKYINPGNYEMHIVARKHGQVMDTKKVYVDVPLSISESPLFWGGLFSLILSSLGVFLWWRSRQQKLILEKELELSKMKTAQKNLSVQAIISSFNPHFINNSLHWVQSKYRKDQEMATVVGRLSENTRYIFNKTKQGVATHNIRQELEVVANYVQIQKVRFKDTFEYIAPSPNTIERLGHHSIFLMMLQIHVENAIEHGLRNRKKSSYVSLDISEEDDMVLIKIEDDGIGRKGAKKIGSKGTESGVRMLKELISIFNNVNSRPIKMEYMDDIFEEEGLGYGTLLTISIPKDYNFLISDKI